MELIQGMCLKLTQCKPLFRVSAQGWILLGYVYDLKWTSFGPAHDTTLTTEMEFMLSARRVMDVKLYQE